MPPSSDAPRLVRVPALAKINLTLKVLHKRADQYHELRSVFQTISVADSLELEFRPSRSIRVEMECTADIPNNIATRAALLLMETHGIRGHVTLRLKKRIPMGGGLGGGSTNAAAVLLALPALAGKSVPLDALIATAAQLGSDVPFFLLGGSALGLGRGEELYPFPQPKPAYGLLATPDIHVSTPEAYRALNRHLTVTADSRIMNTFQSLSWGIREGLGVQFWGGFCQNDFEQPVFRQHPQIARWKKKMIEAGATLALMTGSGSALFGFFPNREDASNAAAHFPVGKSVVFRTVSRAQYQSLWWKSLGALARNNTWPPQSRYVK